MVYSSPLRAAAAEKLARLGNSVQIALVERTFMKSAKFRSLTSNAVWFSVPRNNSYRSHNLVSADHVRLAVVGDLLDLALAEITLHLTAIEALGLSRHP
jgi:hypothetical protein